MNKTKKRNIVLTLTDKDMESFLEKCIGDGTSPEEVLEGFINDLICGSESRGSDERMYAEQYYDRCGYGYYYPDGGMSFLQWLIRNDAHYEVNYYLCRISVIEEDIQFLEEYPGEAEDNELDDLKEELTEHKNNIEELFVEYLEDGDNANKNLEDGIKSVNAYFELVSKIKDTI